MPKHLLIDTRQTQIQIAYELLHNKSHCFYSQGPNRWSWHQDTTLKFPFYGDCSSTCAAIAFFAGGNDPSDVDFAYGNTKTVLLNAQSKKLILSKNQLLPADYALFGWSDATTPAHMAFALQSGLNPNPFFFSMGEQGDPSIVSLKELLTIGPAIYVRNKTRA
jgi:hypothetical protein